MAKKTTKKREMRHGPMVLQLAAEPTRRTPRPVTAEWSCNPVTGEETIRLLIDESNVRTVIAMNGSEAVAIAQVLCDASRDSAQKREAIRHANVRRDLHDRSRAKK